MNDHVLIVGFWLSLVLISVLDVALAMAVRKYQYRSERSWFLDLPALTYCCSLVATHICVETPFYVGASAVLVLPGLALTVIGWELYDGAPMHPLVGGLLGVVVGNLLWPV